VRGDGGMASRIRPWHDMVELCRGNPDELALWVEPENGGKIGVCLLWIVLGAGVFGATIGMWRAPVQSAYVAVKFPLLIVLTTVANGLINGMMAQLIGARMTFRQVSLAILMSFTIACIILGSLAPLTFFVIWNTPPFGAEGQEYSHQVILLFTVLLLAFSGVVGNVRLYGLLKHFCKDRLVAMRVLFVWLAGNLFLGAQLSWNLRPFIGGPSGEVEFLRSNWNESTFYESVWEMWKSLIMNVF